MEDLGLKDVMLIIWKRKWLVAIITAFCLIISLLYGFIAVKTSYEAEAVLRVFPMQLKNTDAGLNTISGITEYILKDPSITLEAYAEQVKFTSVLEAAVKILKSDHELNYSISGLRSAISLRSPANTNIIYLKATDSVGDNAVKMSNAVADAFIGHTNSIMREQAESALEFISGRLLEESENAEENLLLLAEFQSKPMGVDELQGELDGSLDLLGRYKKEIAGLEADAGYYTKGLEAALLQLESVPEYFALIKAVGDDVLLAAALANESGQDLSDIADVVMVEQVPNESYVYLVNKISDYSVQIEMNSGRIESLAQKIEDVRKNLETIQTELIIRQDEYRALSENLRISQDNRDFYMKELKIAETKLAANIGSKSVSIISDARSFTAKSASKKLIAIIGLIAGLAIGFFAAFLENAWHGPKRMTQE